eukprot:g4601.t1
MGAVVSKDGAVGRLWSLATQMLLGQPYFRLFLAYTLARIVAGGTLDWWRERRRQLRKRSIVDADENSPRAASFNAGDSMKKSAGSDAASRQKLGKRERGEDSRAGPIEYSADAWLHRRLKATADGPILLYISGDRSQVGKSSFCLGLIGSLLRSGFPAEAIGYIKPATQCEATQLVVKYCENAGVDACGIGPVVYYSGFTRAFLDGETADTPELIDSVKQAVIHIGRGKRVVVIDGVGYPAVGSICGTSNAAAAKALGAPVLLVGKRGVGDAVDSFNLNRSFFELHGVPIIGAVFNRLPKEGYYCLDNCREHVTKWFQRAGLEKKLFGFLPEVDLMQRSDESAADFDDIDRANAEMIIDAVHAHCSVLDIVRAASSATPQ